MTPHNKTKSWQKGIIIILATLLSTSIQAKIDHMTKKFPEPSMAKFQQMFPHSFKVWSPSVKNHMLGLEFACPMRGNNTSPAISWSGLPKGTTRLHLTIEDGVCTWGCDSRGKADHWILDFPLNAYKTNKFITKDGITQGAGSKKQMRPYTLPNATGKRNYFGMCSPKGQPHAWVIQLTAYKVHKGKRIILGKTQSIPFLFPRKEL